MESVTNINFYPGHMAKAKQNIINDLKLIDIVIEVLDARIPISSRNNDLEKLMLNKKKIVILNKADLADDNITAKWINNFKSNKVTAIAVEANNKKYAKKIIDTIKSESKEIVDAYAKKGRSAKRIRVMIYGIPNVGKSTIINLLAGKNIAKSENRPGVTKDNQWIKISENIDLMDTPGMLWPRLENEEVKLNLAYTNSIPENVIDKEEIAFYLLKFLMQHYSKNIEKRYGIEINKKENQKNIQTNNNINYYENKIDDKEKNTNIKKKDEELNSGILEIREEIAFKTGAILSGNNVDEMKVSNIILNDFRSGKLGKISIEMPPSL